MEENTFNLTFSNCASALWVPLSSNSLFSGNGDFTVLCFAHSISLLDQFYFIYLSYLLSAKASGFASFRKCEREQRSNDKMSTNNLFSRNNEKDTPDQQDERCDSLISLIPFSTRLDFLIPQSLAVDIRSWHSRHTANFNTIDFSLDKSKNLKNFVIKLVVRAMVIFCEIITNPKKYFLAWEWITISLDLNKNEIIKKLLGSF